VNQSVSYAPSYGYALTPTLGEPVPGEAVGSGPDPLGDEALLVYDTTANLTRTFGPRSTFVFESNYRYSDLMTDADSAKVLTSYRLGGRYTHSMTRNTSLRMGYRYRKGEYRLVPGDSAIDPTTRAAATAIHDIDAGIDYGRTLSFSRKTTLNFSVGSSIINAPTSAGSLEDIEFVYNVVGNVALNHQIGRTWSARVTYDRGVGFSETFSEPVFSNAVNASLEGFISRRTEFSSRFGLAIGDVGFGSESSAFSTYTGSARVRSAISQNWAVFVEYSYYSQDLGEAPIAPDEVPPVLDRHSGRVGLTFWFPIWRN
jgi:opacity protein-like surface antigen